MRETTFSQLLAQHMQRVGISDSELARTIGVQRQTIFRWKEGLVTRPRVREDVLRIATKLRLTPVERDQLLLAAGFPPETLTVEQPPPSTPPTATIPPPVQTEPVLPPVAQAEPTSNPVVEPDQSPSPISTPPIFTMPKARIGRWSLVGLAGTLLVVMLGALFFRNAIPSLWPATPTPPPPTRVAVNLNLYPSARAGQKLLLVAQFTRYTNEQFNLAGRIAEQLEKAIATASLPDAGVAIWPDAIASQAEAERALGDAGAALIIWGEYDSGRVRATLTLSDQLLTQHIDFPLTSEADLVTMINEDVPAEVRMFALLTVGNLYPMDKFYAEAAKTFQQALDLQPGQQNTRALLNFYIARAVSRSGALADLDQAIDHYTQALALNPRLYDALYNRGTVWLHRSYLVEAGSAEITRSLDAAIADLTQTVAARTWYADAWLNRGIAYYERNAAEDQRAAIQDFNRVIELQRRDYRGYYHRALARIRAGGTEDWTGDLTQVLEMRPNDASAYNAFCWGYALAQQPEFALPNCDRAVELDPTGASHDGRGITLSQLGRYEEAIVELEAYLAWIRPLKPASLFRRLRGPQMEQWIRALKQGENPFDATTLATLR